jgi:hypothetical protein
MLALVFAAAASLLGVSVAGRISADHGCAVVGASTSTVRRPFRRRARAASDAHSLGTPEPTSPSAVKVSFVIPCHRLAHLLGECVDSILAQSYGDFEVLIMDDCSPDATPEVAASFPRPRVRHVRNDTNLGHLANYNKGIQLSKANTCG